MPIFIENLDLGAMFDVWDLQRRGSSSEGERPCRDPAFHEYIVIIVPLGPTGFLKVTLGLEIDPILFFSVFLLAIGHLTF